MSSIFFWRADSAGSGFYRSMEPARVLAARGHKATSSPYLPGWAREADVVVGQRICTPTASKRWAELAKEGRAKLVFEIDDDLLNVDPSNLTAHGFFSQPEIHQGLQRNATLAHEVVVTTERLAEIFAEINPNVRIIPNYVPESMLAVQRPTPERPVVGWYGSPSHTRDFEKTAPQLVRFMRRNPKADFHALGSRLDWMASIEHRQFRFTGWNDSIAGLWRTVDFTVGLAVMRRSEFNRSKSDLKIKEMAALGIPSVVTNFAAYEHAAMTGAPVLTVDRPNGWAPTLEYLLDDEEARTELGAKAKAWASSQTIEQHAGLWEALLP
ncbi:glycosyltransferase [Pseudonocardia tropica]|uniref:Glycosyltransferase n=1 Tax=Pseudonocardia tropica TaxID=681289 RepID=A0ABV1JS14_9PSEU